jgi:hypothetical protein
MAERLEGLVNTLRRFVADAAHELNTPLAILHTDLELLIASGPEPRQRQLADRSLVQAQRLEALVGGLLDLSRLEAAPLEQSSVPLDLAALAQEIAERYAAQAEQAGLAFDLDLPSGPPVVVQGSSRSQAIGNLLETPSAHPAEAARLASARQTAGPTEWRIRASVSRPMTRLSCSNASTAAGTPPLIRAAGWGWRSSSGTSSGIRRAVEVQGAVSESGCRAAPFSPMIFSTHTHRQRPAILQKAYSNQRLRCPMVSRSRASSLRRSYQTVFKAPRPAAVRRLKPGSRRAFRLRSPIGRGRYTSSAIF